MISGLDEVLNAATFASPLAETALYTPVGAGGAQEVRVVVLQPSDLTPDFGGAAVYASGIVLDVSPEQVPAPSAGDVFVVLGETWTVLGEARMVDGCWRVSAR